MDPVALRRGIGYVIQQVGLFPHMTIAANIATVPRLLGWDDARTAQRIDELLQLVGMEPASFRDRYPRELSGGQRQRIGVARALAADPPVLLMDEPFGAIDPINRTRVQDEFLKIQRQLRKTVVFVTHDIDEAIKMGDRIALLRDGRLVQHAPPAEMLAHPANGFVEDFVGADRALKRLSLITCVSLASPGLRRRRARGLGGDLGTRRPRADARQRCARDQSRRRRRCRAARGLLLAEELSLSERRGWRRLRCRDARLPAGTDAPGTRRRARLRSSKPVASRRAAALSDSRH